MLKQKLKELLFHVLETQPGQLFISRIAERIFTLPHAQIESNPELKKIYDHQLWQGLVNLKVIPFTLHRNWPSWVNNQFNPDSPHFNSHLTAYWVNNTSNKNWTALSYPNTNATVVVDAQNLISPLPQNWSLESFIATKKGLISSSNSNEIKQVLDVKNPKIISSCTLNDITLLSETFLSPINQKKTILFTKFQLKNETNSEKKCSFFIAIRPYNIEGVAHIKEITFLSENTFIINNQLGLILDKKPDNVVCSNFQDKDISSMYEEWEMILSTQCSSGMASAFAEYKLHLKPGDCETISVKMPLQKNHLRSFLRHTLSKKSKKKLKKDILDLKLLSFNDELSHLAYKWETQLEPLCSVSLPNKKMELAFKQNQLHGLSFLENKQSLTHIWPKLSTPAHIPQLILSLDSIGAVTYTQTLIQEMLETISLKCHSATIIGQLLHSFENHYKLNPCPHLLQKHIKKIEKLVKGLVKQCYPLRPNNLYSGLYKKSHSDYTSGQKNQYLWDNFWILAALDSLIFFNQELNRIKHNPYYQEKRNHLLQSINRFCQTHSQLHKLAPLLPINATSYQDTRLINNLACVYPLSIYNFDEEKVLNTLRTLEENSITKHRLLNSVGNAGFDTLQNITLAKLYIRLKKEQAFPLIDWLMRHCSLTGVWPENIHPIHNTGCFGEGHFGPTGTSFLSLVRDMLTYENDETLELLPFIPKNWIEDQKEIKLHNCPSRFGVLSFKIKIEKNCFHLTQSHAFHSRPKKIHLYFPFPITSITLHGKTYQSKTPWIVLSDKNDTLTCQFSKTL